MHTEIWAVKNFLFAAALMWAITREHDKVYDQKSKINFFVQNTQNRVYGLSTEECQHGVLGNVCQRL